jgi:phosphotransferase system  glucose/maltose/N-acetylglucosamine-specific IIC component
MFLLRLLKRLIKALVILVVIIVLIPIAGLTYGFLTTDAIDTAPLAGVSDPNGRSSMRRASMPAS